MIKKIIYFPESTQFNEYVELTFSVIKEICPNIQPIPSIRDFPKFPRRNETLAILNWFEDQLAWNIKNRNKIFFKSIINLIYLYVSCKKIIWVRHNFWPHDMPRRSIRQKLLFLILNIVATTTVTHRPLKQFHSKVIPHPLYANSDDLNSVRDIKFLYFGMIKRYKALDKLLASWPIGQPLIIAGAAPDELLIKELQNQVSNRGLNVQFICRFLPQNELEAMISRTQYVVLPHTENSMIVTGAFYHAASFGANILVADGDFGEYARKTFRFVNTFKYEDIENTLNKLQYCVPKEVLNSIQCLNGRNVCVEAWRKLLT